MAELVVSYRPIASLKPNPRNARTHSKKQIRQIAACIAEFGFLNPVLIDGESVVIAGHGRVEAAKLLGFDPVPTIRIEHLSEAQKRGYILADNKLAENAGWDEEILAIELQHLLEIDLDFDIGVTGFETSEIDFLILNAHPEADNDPDADMLPEEVPEAPAVSRLGDLWQLGRHRLVCGDATATATYDTLMTGEKARLVFTDPPYNVAIDGHVCGSGAIKHREFVMASGEMSEAEFTAFLAAALGRLAGNSLDGSIHYICMDWRHLAEVLAAGRQAYTELKNVCVWNKENGGMGSFYRSKHELVLVFKHGKAPHVNNFGLGDKGRYRTNVWDYPGVNSLRPGRGEELAMHPTVKPVAMVADAILDCSNRGDLVLDAFAGSGTILIAAERTGRRARAIELDPRYVDTAIRRWQAYAKVEAVLAETGQTFAEVKLERLSDPESRSALSGPGKLESRTEKKHDHDRET